ncbi:g5955 [Coccomyxa elongata]
MRPAVRPVQVTVRLQSSSTKHEQSKAAEDEATNEELNNLKVPDTTPNFRRSSSNEQASTSGRLPQTVQDLQNVIASNCPVFYLHPEERYFPCTVQWFLERCELQLIRKGWRRRVLRVIERVGEVDGESLKRAQAWFGAQPFKRSFMMLRLVDPAHRAGQPDRLNQVPIYAHAKQVVDPRTGCRTALEINYMKFLAFNGSYKLFGWIPAGNLGAHDADWEHVTLRLTPDGRCVLGVYYSAHRHQDGVWRSAREVPRSEAGRPLAHIAVNGHGSYPIAGTIPRIFFAANDQTSNQGAVWDTERCMIVTNNGRGGALPKVEDRGSDLDGTSYAALGSSADSGTLQGQRPAAAYESAEWLDYGGRWGTTVEAPAKQDWFARAENPVSRTWLQQVLFPLAPGIESIYEPAMEEVEEALEGAHEKMEHVQSELRQEADYLQRKVEGWVKGGRK